MKIDQFEMNKKNYEGEAGDIDLVRDSEVLEMMKHIHES